MDDFDTYPDTNNQNELIDSALNNFTIGEGSSRNRCILFAAMYCPGINLILAHQMMSYLNDPSRLHQMQLDPLDSYYCSRSTQKNKLDSNSTTSRKRRLVVDNVKVITENDDKSLINFRSIVNPPISTTTLPSQIYAQKENIPPTDPLLISMHSSTLPLMTVPSWLKCVNVCVE